MNANELLCCASTRVFFLFNNQNYVYELRHESCNFFFCVNNLLFSYLHRRRIGYSRKLCARISISIKRMVLLYFIENFVLLLRTKWKTKRDCIEVNVTANICNMYNAVGPDDTPHRFLISLSSNSNLITFLRQKCLFQRACVPRCEKTHKSIGPSVVTVCVCLCSAAAAATWRVRLCRHWTKWGTCNKLSSVREYMCVYFTHVIKFILRYLVG